MTRPSQVTPRTAKAKAVVLLSGGLDSYTACAIALTEGFQCYALSVDYGQRHRCELDAAANVASTLQVAEHRIMQVDLRCFGGSALTGEIPVPKSDHQPPNADTIPVTYVPARNTILLAFALSWAEVLGAFDIFIGANAVDYSGYPDCRSEFIDAFERLANLATKATDQSPNRFGIHAPLISMTKAEIITRGTELELDYSLTHSCYDPNRHGRPCGRCDSCLLRLKGFTQAGLKDPLEYSSR